MSVVKTYINTWKHYQKTYGEDTCLFYMVGKFYELYDLVDPKTGEGQTNVKQAANMLGLTITSKEDGSITAGFPEQSVQKFASLLTRDGWTVVVCDQEKDSKGSVSGRPCARIFSPGTHIENAGAEACYLAGLWLEETEQAPLYAVAVLDMTTGHLISYESKCIGNKEIWSADELVHFFQVHPPRELVVWWRGAKIAIPSEAVLRRRLGLQRCLIHIDTCNPEQQGALEKDFVRKTMFEKFFSKKLCLLPILEQLHLSYRPTTERVLINLLHFAQDHLPSAIQNLSDHQLWNPKDAVYLGNNTLSQLNMISQQQHGEQSVLSLFSKSYTSIGKRALRERLLSPSCNGELIQKRLDEVEYAYQLPVETWRAIEGCLKQIHDIARLHRKISMFSLTASDVLALDQSYGNIRHIMNMLKDSPLELLFDDLVQEYRKLFDQCFSIEKAKLAIKQEDLYFLPEAKAPKTHALEQKIVAQKKKLEEAMETIRQWANLPDKALTLEMQDSGAYAFTGTKTTLSLIKRQLTKDPPYADMSIHEKKTSRGSVDCSFVNQTNLILFQLRAQLQAAFKEELTNICIEVQHPAWDTLEHWVGFVDTSFTFAKIAKEKGYTKPILVDQECAGLKALGLRHPLLESIQTKVEYVRHNVCLGMDDEDQGWLLYGMNASGKSSLMKAIGISILLAQAGSYVPATQFSFAPFQSILTRILNQDNLWAGLSSFAVEVSELRDIFQKADAKSLVLGDELCSGTESISATSLVAAGIQHLHEKQSRFVFATHLHGLMNIPEIAHLPHLGIWHLKVHYEPTTDILIYDRTLHRGPGGTMYGLEVAKAMHLPHDIIEQAFKFRHSLLGSKAIEEASPSSYNSLVVIKECEVCSSPIVRDLEVHHIRPQKDAKQKRFEDGSHMNDLRNLIVVCSSCHDKHHNGELEIGKEKQTSVGPQREIVEKPKQAEKEKEKPKAKSKWSAEQQQIIESYLRKYVHLSLSRIKYDLKQEQEIDISEAALGKIRNSLS